MRLTADSPHHFSTGFLGFLGRSMLGDRSLAPANQRGIAGFCCRGFLLWVAVLWCGGGCTAIRARTETRTSTAATNLARQGLEAIHLERWEYAEELFAAALALHPADDRANWGMAETLWHRGEPAEAIQYMQNAVRLSDGHPERIVRLGRMQFDHGNLEAAEELRTASLRSGRHLPQTWALHGDCLQQRGETDSALAAYHRALALQPDFPEVQLSVAELYRQQGRHDRLLATLDRLQDHTNECFLPERVMMLRGIALRHLGRHDDASRCFRKIIELTPNDPIAFLQLATVAIEINDLESAEQAISQALQLDPTLLVATDLRSQVRQQLQLASQSDAKKNPH